MFLLGKLLLFLLAETLDFLLAEVLMFTQLFLTEMLEFLLMEK